MITAPGVLLNDNDLNTDILTVLSRTNTLNGKLYFIQNGRFLYKPDLGFSGNDSFTRTISYGNGGQANVNVLIKVNRNPEGADAYFSVAAGGNLGSPYPGLLTNAIDPDGDPLTICDNSNPTNPKVETSHTIDIENSSKHNYFHEDNPNFMVPITLEDHSFDLFTKHDPGPRHITPATSESHHVLRLSTQSFWTKEIDPSPPFWSEFKPYCATVEQNCQQL